MTRIAIAYDGLIAQIVINLCQIISAFQPVAIISIGISLRHQHSRWNAASFLGFWMLGFGVKLARIAPVNQNSLTWIRDVTGHVFGADINI